MVTRSGGVVGGAVAAPPMLLIRSRSQVLAGVDDPFDAPGLVLGLADERLHVDDSLALLARDLSPVVGVRRVRQVLVLLELLANGREEVVEGDALLALADVALEGQLLGPPH